MLEQLDPQIADWYFKLAPYEQRQLLADAANVLSRGKQSPDNWADWLYLLFPNLFYRSFADRHIDFWTHINAIEFGIKPQAFFAIWPRGGGKTTNAESAAVYLGAKEKRKFCLYTRSTQDKANESVLNIAAMLESKKIAEYYPQLAERKLGKYGNVKGWRINTLRCANNFNVVALGYDAAVRGIKIEEFRPDVIFVDDIDDKDDTPEATQKKINTLIYDILPAGSSDVAVIGIQNLIHPDSIFSKISDSTAEFLYNRIVSGPYPALLDFEYEQRPYPKKGYQITRGTPTWEGQNIEACQNLLDDIGLSSFLSEAQHEVSDPPGGMYSHLEYRYCEHSELPDLERIVGYVDPATTDTDSSDSQGINFDGLSGETIYRLYSWEGRTSPENAIKRALLKAIELGADTLGFETDQGGELWQSDYNHVCDKIIRLVMDKAEYDEADELDQQIVELLRAKVIIPTPENIRKHFPGFTAAKAGSIGSKVHRGNMQLLQYEQGRFVHVRGTHKILEKALNRFPKKKPFDLHDAAFWSQFELVEGSGEIIPIALGNW
jgi:hypothetical protein